jgi:hypothetical protein
LTLVTSVSVSANVNDSESIFMEKVKKFKTSYIFHFLKMSIFKISSDYIRGRLYIHG